MIRLVAALALLAASCGDAGPTPVPDTVDRAGLSPECVAALDASPALPACVEFCDSCELDTFESCRDRCAMSEVIATAEIIEQARACWFMARMCTIADAANCDVLEDWVDPDRAIEACAGDL